MSNRWILRTGLIALFTLLLFSMVVMLLWNWLMPSIFHAPELNIWQAAGLLLLSKILFGGFGPGNWGGGNRVRRKVWKGKFNEKWSCITSEEKRYTSYQLNPYKKPYTSSCHKA